MFYVQNEKISFCESCIFCWFLFFLVQGKISLVLESILSIIFPCSRRKFLYSDFPFSRTNFLSDNLSINLSLVMEKIFYCSEIGSEYKSLVLSSEYKKRLVPFLTYSNNQATRNFLFYKK